MTGEKVSHVAVAVGDLERAMSELGHVLGLSWAPPRSVETEFGTLRLSYSRSGPPYMELIEGPEGSPWDARSGGGLHHVGYWSDDLESDRDRLLAGGMEVVYDGTRSGGSFAYLRAASGLVVELTRSSREPALLEWLAAGRAPGEATAGSS